MLQSTTVQCHVIAYLAFNWWFSCLRQSSKATQDALGAVSILRVCSYILCEPRTVEVNAVLLNFSSTGDHVYTVPCEV